VRAFQVVAWQKPPELRELPVPEPEPGQILVKVGGAGACHSDLHLMQRPAPKRPIKLPFTLGHENAGWVETLGPGATGFAPADPVIVYGPWGCGNCKNCRMSMENYCENAGGIARGGGLGGYDGGMARYLLVPSTRFLVPLGTLDPREAAPLRRGAHQLPRRQAVASSARGRLHRCCDRCRRRSRPDCYPASAGARRGNDHRRG
jgi:alcohol dehydrogenase, propanol-preferring